MFARVVALLPLALLASATHLAARGNSCNASGGTQACCDHAFSQDVLPFDQHDFADVILDLAAVLGVGCSGISVQTCNQQNLCCDHDQSEGGLINVSCNNINLI